eukprot:1483306-Prymnesium_polylepis.1
MAGFVGYLVHAQHIHFPWTPYPGFDAAADALLSPPEQWDAVPYNGKLQILLAIGFLEWWSEIRVDGTPHYMKGGKPGCARSRAVPRLPSLRRDQHSTGARRAACCALTRLRALRCARSYFPDFDAVPSQLPHWIGLNLYVRRRRSKSRRRAWAACLAAAAHAVPPPMPCRRSGVSLPRFAAEQRRSSNVASPLPRRLVLRDGHRSAPPARLPLGSHSLSRLLPLGSPARLPLGSLSRSTAAARPHPLTTGEPHRGTRSKLAVALDPLALRPEPSHPYDPDPCRSQDPFKWSKKMTPEKKALRLNMELNNGRLAMIGLMGFLSAQKIEGSVPLLKGIVAPYDGEVMAPLFGAGAPAFWS